ncbi:hypothetical protein L2E82_50937 [Cichorium intybus]|nr:hypothetical protein L2E82_50937 [Cichorium intybus]
MEIFVIRIPSSSHKCTHKLHIFQFRFQQQTDTMDSMKKLFNVVLDSSEHLVFSKLNSSSFLAKPMSSRLIPPLSTVSGDVVPELPCDQNRFRSHVSRAPLRTESLVSGYVPETGCLSIIVLGASGDLAKKKTFPALFHLYRQGFIQSQDVHIFGYLTPCKGCKRSHGEGIPISSIADLGGWTRIVIEKPFGRDLESAEELSAQIDPFFLTLWNRDNISNIQIIEDTKIVAGWNLDKEKCLLQWGENNGVKSRFDIAYIEGAEREAIAREDLEVGDIPLEIPVSAMP